MQKVFYFDPNQQNLVPSHDPEHLFFIWTVFRVVIWHPFLEIWAKVKNFLKLSHLWKQMQLKVQYYVRMPMLLRIKSFCRNGIYYFRVSLESSQESFVFLRLNSSPQSYIIWQPKLFLAYPWNLQNELFLSHFIQSEILAKIFFKVIQ